MKGDNVIEDYCPVCSRPITAGDLGIGYVERVGDRLTCLYHLERTRKLFANEKIMTALDTLLKEQRDLTSFQSKMEEVLEKTGLPKTDVVYALKAFCSKLRSDQWQSTKKY